MASRLRLKYHELCSLPTEQEVAGPTPTPPNMKFFIRREIADDPYDDDTPKGTVVVSVCIDVYQDGKFKCGFRPSVEKTPKGAKLDPLRGWEGD